MCKWASGLDASHLTFSKAKKQGRGMRIQRLVGDCWKGFSSIAGSSLFAVPICAGPSFGVVCYLYLLDENSDRGEPFAWFDGTSVWFSFVVILFAALLSVHFIIKTNWDLVQNAHDLTENFGLNDKIEEKTSFFGWDFSSFFGWGLLPLVPGRGANAKQRVAIDVLWQLYLCRGRFLMRILRTAPRAILYIIAVLLLALLIGDWPEPPRIGDLQLLVYR